MPIVVRTGGGAGGGGLNFKVVQYTETPTGTAAENTIGVVTDTAITGWVMQAEEPAASAGLVWIEVTAESDVAFYADKKQYLKVYPKEVKQYVSGAWAKVDAYIYQNGWVSFSTVALYLYNNGNEYESLTGGWMTYAQTHHDNSGISSTAHPVITRNATTIKFSNASWKAGSVALQNKIDLTSVNTLVAKGTFYTSEGDAPAELLVKTSSGASADSYKVANYAVPRGETVNIMTLDVSSLSGEYYIFFHVAHLSTIELTEFYGE